MKSPVIRDIVENNLCIGCGLCAATCPQHSLEMVWNPYGEYNPVAMRSCDKECGVCLKTCPFADGNDNEDIIGKSLYGRIPEISHRLETGYFLDCYVGYAPDTRERGSSGGMATWLFSTLLKKGIVDYVIAVIANDDPDRLFKFTIFSNHEDVINSSGSAYYPVELSGVIREIQKRDGKCAVVGLPCFIKAIRLAAQKNKKLNEKIFVMVGLVCGQLKSKHFTGYISALSKVDGSLRKVIFRGKSPQKPASNYYFSSTNTKGVTGKIFWNEGVSDAWLNRWFTPNPCNYCDDIFAECADVTFMDAWLPEYVKHNQGTSIVLVRSQLVREVIFHGMTDNEVNLGPIMIEKVIQSQAGIIEIKRRHLAFQLYLGHQRSLKIPKKRVAPIKLSNPFLSKQICLKNQMQAISREIWDPREQNVELLNQKMQPFLAQQAKLNRFSRIFRLPIKAVRLTKRKIRRFLNGKG